MKSKGKKISVVISAYNEELMLPDCLISVSWADEIVVIDNSSIDKTAEIAKKHSAVVFTRPNYTMLNTNKNFGFSKATGVWILNIDADERVSKKLRDEIRDIVTSNEIQASKQNIIGYKIPRKNIIFGKWIEHTGWWPDYQLRLFKKGKGKFAQKHVHEQIEVSGEIDTLSGPILHENYQSISQFISKLNTYTENEAEQIIIKGYTFSALDALRFPKEEFFRRYFAQAGYKDGFHGLMLSMAMSMYHFVIFLKLWEHAKFITPKTSNKSFIAEASKSYREGLHWLSQTGRAKLSIPRRILIRLGL